MFSDILIYFKVHTSSLLPHLLCITLKGMLDQLAKQNGRCTTIVCPICVTIRWPKTNATDIFCEEIAVHQPERILLVHGVISESFISRSHRRKGACEKRR